MSDGTEAMSTVHTCHLEYALHDRLLPGCDLVSRSKPKPSGTSSVKVLPVGSVPAISRSAEILRVTNFPPALTFTSVRNWDCAVLAGLEHSPGRTYPFYAFLSRLTTGRLVMRFCALLLATAALLLPTANTSPTSILPSFLASWSEGRNSLRREPTLNVDDTTKFERRQTTNPFDHNPDGSKFLWVLQDTYQGQTFFEYVIGTRCVDRTHSLTSLDSRWTFFADPDPTK